MKKFLPGIIALGLVIVVGIALSSQSAVRKNLSAATATFNGDSAYFKFNGGASEIDVANYAAPQAASPGNCPGTGKTCWIRVPDVDQDGDVDTADFNAFVPPIDMNNDKKIWDNIAEGPGFEEIQP
jgi:hypothetical protein